MALIGAASVSVEPEATLRPTSAGATSVSPPIELEPPVARMPLAVRVSVPPGPVRARPPPVSFRALIVRVAVFITTLVPIWTVLVADVPALRLVVS